MIKLFRGDSLIELDKLEENSVDAAILDPPAAIGFMGKSWDGDKGGRQQWIDWLASILTKVRRSLKPGAYMLVWALPRTSHWTGMAIEDAGFYIQDQFDHIFGTGYPKYYNVAKGVESYLTTGSASWNSFRNLNGERVQNGSRGPLGLTKSNFEQGYRDADYQASGVLELVPTTEEAKEWMGWTDALAPGHEVWWLAQKPLSEKNIVQNVLRWGTGGLNTGAVRVAAEGRPKRVGMGKDTPGKTTYGSGAIGGGSRATGTTNEGRWTKNILFTHSVGCDPEGCLPGCPVLELDEQGGYRTSGKAGRRRTTGAGYQPTTYGTESRPAGTPTNSYADSGGVSRYYNCFYYVPKPTRKEKDEGLELLATRTFNRVNSGGLENDPRWAPTRVKNHHPTVKAVTLMDHFVKLVCPLGGVVLDCFMGSGRTGIAAVNNGMSFIGVEKEEDYFTIAQEAIASAIAENGTRPQEVIEDLPEAPRPVQLNLFGEVTA